MSGNELKLCGRVRVLPTVDELYDELAGALMSAAEAAVAERGVFHMALSGGSSPGPFYMRLVTDPRFRGVPWHATHVWMVDERRVPVTDDRSNFKMIRETLVDQVALPVGHAHPVPTMLEDPAGVYERELRGAMNLEGGVPVLDFVLLGMGEDAHTASLFAGSPAIGVRDRLIANNDGPCVTPPPRVTMTYPLLNAARELAVLVTGKKKASTLRLVDEQLRGKGPDPGRLPITGVRPGRGKMTWYLDAAAAGEVDP